MVSCARLFLGLLGVKDKMSKRPRRIASPMISETMIVSVSLWPAKRVVLPIGGRALGSVMARSFSRWMRWEKRAQIGARPEQTAKAMMGVVSFSIRACKSFESVGYLVYYGKCESE